MQLYRPIHVSEAVQWLGDMGPIYEFLRNQSHIEATVPAKQKHLVLRFVGNRLVVHPTQWLVRSFTPFDEYTVMTDREFRNTYTAVTRMFPSKSTLQEVK